MACSPADAKQYHQSEPFHGMRLSVRFTDPDGGFGSVGLLNDDLARGQHHPSAWGDTTLRRDDAAPRRRTNDSARGAVERTGYVAFVGLKGQQQMEQIGTVVAVLLRDRASGFVEIPFVSKNPDVQHLGGRSGLPPVFIRRMVGWFGEAIALEALRQFRPGGDAAYFVGICRRLERS